MPIIRKRTQTRGFLHGKTKYTGPGSGKMRQAFRNGNMIAVYGEIEGALGKLKRAAMGVNKKEAKLSADEVNRTRKRISSHRKELLSLMESLGISREFLNSYLLPKGRKRFVWAAKISEFKRIEYIGLRAKEINKAVASGKASEVKKSIVNAFSDMRVASRELQENPKSYNTREYHKRARLLNKQWVNLSELINLFKVKIK